MRIPVSRIVLVVAALLLGTLPTRAAGSAAPVPGITFFPPPPSTGPIAAYDWIGGYMNRTFAGAYGGVVGAVNGNVYSDGVLLRLDGLGGDYKYSSPAFPNIEVGIANGDAMVGYRKKVGDGFVTGYVGVAFESHDNPDPAAALRGTEVGGKVLGEYSTPITKYLDFYGFAYYATPFQSYQAYAHLGFKVAPKVTIGPEVGETGNKVYREDKIGGFVGFELPFGRFIVSSGYYQPHTSSSSGLGTQPGAYLNLFLGFDFHGP